MCIKGFARHLFGLVLHTLWSLQWLNRQLVPGFYVSEKAHLHLLCVRRRWRGKKTKHCWWSFILLRAFCALLICWKSLSDPYGDLKRTFDVAEHRLHNNGMALRMPVPPAAQSFHLFSEISQNLVHGMAQTFGWFSQDVLTLVIPWLL